MAKPGRKPKVEASDVLDVFAARDDPDEPLTATEVGDKLRCSRRTALNHLDALAETGEVTSKKVGGRARVWWVPGDAKSPLFAFERAEDKDAALKRLSNDLGEPITVGQTVYEDGDSHPLDTAATREDGEAA